MTPDNRLLISPGPHLWKGLSVNKIMYQVVIALMFPTGAAIYFFGPKVIPIMGVSVGVSILTEYLCKKLRGRAFIMDGSAVITGLLLALVLPPSIPLWMVAIGAVFAIAIVKEAFGGLGHNIFNPALGARAFMSVSFSAEMTTWTPTRFMPDAVTCATPLNESFVWQGSQASLYHALFMGNTAGSLGETSVLFILIGGILLIGLRTINWRIPVTYIGMVALMALAFGQDPLLYILSGGLMLGAFFMATDYVTSPLTNQGKIIFGIALGLVTVLIRHFGSMPEGVCFSILLMNAFVPLIDRFIRPKPYGVVKVVKKVSSEG
ncbi:MAG: RnfABCDGE type electron transport complex subunit D [Dehalococcoidales bacterium]|nr:RnfABCDGE type electron transport complex subunit D [Dehalococcoidales bacterium]